MKMKIFAFVCAALLSVGTLVVGAWSSEQSSPMECQCLDIQICDSAEHQFVSVDELRRTLHRNGVAPVGKDLSEVSCQTIEDILLQHSMIRTAECYKLSTGVMCVDVTQRVPMLQVITADGSYFVDTDRKVMPVRSTINVDVPVLKGNVNQQAATEEYYDFVEWLKNNRYWKNRITGIHVRNSEYVVLSQREVQGNIILGELDGYEEKMARLRKLYTDGLDEIGYKPYKEYDLRFDGQVIGRK